MVFSAFLSPMLTVLERLFDSVAPSICLILDEEESLLAQKPTLSKLVPTVNVRFITLFCFLGYWSRVVLSTPTSQPTSQTQNIDLNFFQPFQGIKITGVSGSFGFVVDSCDVNGDGIPDFIGSAPYANSNVGLVAVVYGGLGQGTVNINTMTPSEGFLIYGDSSLFSATDKPRTGAALACVGDFNGDTYQDIGIGAVGGASIAPGRAYLIFGKNKTNTNIYLQNLTLSQGFYVTRLGATSSVGYSVRGIDANKDGYSDFLVGELYGAHQNYLIYGRASDWQNLNFASLNSAYGITFSNFCPDTNNYCYGGYAVGNANDVNGDGVPDMIMSAYRYTYLPTSFVWIVYGSYTISGLNLLSSPLSKAFRISGRSFDRLGTVLSQGAGNFNGDTYSDVLLGSPGDSQYIAYLIYGNKTNAYINATKWDSSRGIRFSRSSNDGTFAAGSVSWLGDLNGDGLDDIGISSITPTGYKRTVYVIFGSKNMVDIQLGSLSPSQGFQIYGTVGTASNNGLRLASLRGDVNGDGWSDYVIGDPDRNTVYIVYGNTYQTSPPSTQPSTSPTKNPSFSPTFPPTRTPTRAPTFPTLIPTQPPTTFPSFLPTSEPTLIPTLVPTLMPTTSPSNQPTTSPTYRPSLCPTLIPTNVPTASPTAFPTVFPSAFPSNEPSLTPSVIPTFLPSGEPTFIPTVLPTNSPTLSPSIFPSTWPSCLPTDNPSRIPTFIPTQLPSCSPSEAPTLLPTLMPTNFPTLLPTDIPTIWPSSVPTGNPSLQPIFSPTLMPSGMPTLVPTLIPTSWPTDSPIFPPTTWPSHLPSPGPSFSPTWVPSISPSHGPTFIPTWVPTNGPTLVPTDIPTIWPSSLPTDNPSVQPTYLPTLMPSGTPILVPTLIPTHPPSGLPTFPPTQWPTDVPSPGPSFSPSWQPSINPTTGKPTWRPTWVPTNTPQPTKSRLASRSITIELADDQQAIGALTEIAYSEQSDQLILATDHFMFSA